MQTGVFSKYLDKAWPHRYEGSMRIAVIHGGVPADLSTAEKWIRAKVTSRSESEIQHMIGQTMRDMGVEVDAAIEKVAADMAGLNGFKRDETGLFIEGRQLKAAIKEAASVAYASGKLLNQQGKNSWGRTSKGILGFIAEHVVVREERLHLYRDDKPLTEPDGTLEHFVHTWRGSAISNEEYAENVTVDFTVLTDYQFSEENWAMIWLTGQEQGIGSSRSQGYGRYEIIRWDRLS